MLSFKPLSENDEFGNALLQMRDGLQKAEQETRFRNWTNNGLARIGEVLRENTDDIEKLSESIIHELVKFFDVNQGGIFLVQGKMNMEKNIYSLPVRMHLTHVTRKMRLLKWAKDLLGSAFMIRKL